MNTDYHIDIFDTFGIPDDKFMRFMRTATLGDSDVVLLCYSCVDENSLTSLENIYIPELSTFENKPPFMLIGTKLDLSESNPNYIPCEEASAFGNRFGAVARYECSALEYGRSNGARGGVDTVFNRAMQLAVTLKEWRTASSNTTCFLCSIV